MIGGLIVTLLIALKNPVVFLLLLTDGLPAGLILAGGAAKATRSRIGEASVMAVVDGGDQLISDCLSKFLDGVES